MLTDIELDTTFFSNMKALKKVESKYGKASVNMLRRYGPAVWDRMCFNWWHIRTADMLNGLVREFRMSRRSAETIFYACVTYCMEAKEDFMGPSSVLVKERNGVYRLIDGNMEGYE